VGAAPQRNRDNGSVKAAMPDRHDAYRVTPQIALEGDVDLEHVVSSIPHDYSTRGMFFTRYVRALGEEWDSVQSALVAPAKDGRYVPFEYYPLRDYVRVLDRVARTRFPGSRREAFRLLARGELDVFADSTLGKVTLSLLKEPQSTLMRFPDIYRVVVCAWECAASRFGVRRVLISFTDYRGIVEQSLGLLEGIVQMFDEVPTVEVKVASDGRVEFDVCW